MRIGGVGPWAKTVESDFQYGWVKDRGDRGKMVYMNWNSRAGMRKHESDLVNFILAARAAAQAGYPRDSVHVTECKFVSMSTVETLQARGTDLEHVINEVYAIVCG